MSPKYFLDCGHYMGATLERYRSAGIIDDEWTVYAFEPNPELVIDGKEGIILIRKAVWIEDTQVWFTTEGRHDAAKIAEGGELKVPAFDFSEFVAKLPDDALIICSMDIEGAEFPVLAKMLIDGTADRLAGLEIEFHHRLPDVDYTAEDAQNLIDELVKRGVRINLKVELN